MVSNQLETISSQLIFQQTTYPNNIPSAKKTIEESDENRPDAEVLQMAGQTWSRA